MPRPVFDRPSPKGVYGLKKSDALTSLHGVAELDLEKTALLAGPRH
jgi:hypothetical protein